jgi:hypothetical protein
MSSGQFSGKLFYVGKSSDHLRVTQFIVRTGEISFALAEVTGEFGPWITSGVAKEKTPGEYLVDGLTAKRDGVSAASPWSFKFYVEIFDMNTLLVSGEIRAGGLTGEFEGELLRVQ